MKEEEEEKNLEISTIICWVVVFRFYYLFGLILWSIIRYMRAHACGCSLSDFNTSRQIKLLRKSILFLNYIIIIICTALLFQIFACLENKKARKIL